MLTPLQLCRFCVLSSNLFLKRSKLCDSHLPYPATRAALSPQTLSDSTTSSLHSLVRIAPTDLGYTIRSLVFSTCTDPPQTKTPRSAQIPSLADLEHLNSIFFHFIPLTVHSISLAAATKMERGRGEGGERSSILLKWHNTVPGTGTSRVSAAGTPALGLQCASDDETGAEVFTGKFPPLFRTLHSQQHTQQ